MLKNLFSNRYVVHGMAALLLIFAPALVFRPVFGYPFLDWDDAAHILQNTHLPDLRYIWTHSLSGMYMPMTFTTWSLLMRMFGPNPAAFHVANLGLHIANSLLVYRILLNLLVPQTVKTVTNNKKMETAVSAVPPHREDPPVEDINGRGRPSPMEQIGLPRLLHTAASSKPSSGRSETELAAMLAVLAGSLLFALHPLQVEPVAWITSLKGLGCAFFSLLAIHQYILCVRAPSIRRYAAALACCAAGLLFHPMAVFVPLVIGILNICVWKRKITLWLPGLVPFVLITALALAANLQTQSSLKIYFHVPLYLRPLIALDALGFYWGKLIWPETILPAYDRSPRFLIQSGTILWSWMPALGALAAGFALRKRVSALWIGMLIFISGVVLTLGLVSFGAQDNSTVYDKYVYLSMLGPAFITAATLAAAKERLGQGYKPWYCVAAVILGLLAAKSAVQARVWRNDRAIWTHVLSKNASSPLALINLGYIESREGRSELAMQYYSRALALKPDDPAMLNNYGAMLAQRGRIEEAGELFLRSLRLGGSGATTLDNLARYYLAKGDMVNAELFARRTIEADPGHVEGNIRLGELLLRQGRLADCAQLLNKALTDTPAIAANADAWTLLGVALAQQGETGEAIKAFRRALHIHPQHESAQRNLAIALSGLNSER